MPRLTKGLESEAPAEPSVCLPLRRFLQSVQVRLECPTPDFG
ncbi:MAG: hypothetical protein NZ741_06590 [Armatimonadetes bacterium]|nr:hypothetical protein [Armatimonadota bacterium]